MNRRDYLKLMGAASASAGLAGCLDVIPGIDSNNDNETVTPTPPVNNATKTPTPTPEPDSGDGLPSRLEFLSRYSRITDVRQDGVDVVLVGDDLRADTDLDEATLTLGAIQFPESPFGEEEPAMTKSTEDVSLPSKGEEREVTLPATERGPPEERIVYYYVKLSDPSLREGEHFIVCESNPFNLSSDGEFREPDRLGLVTTSKGTSTYRRYLAEGYYLIAARGDIENGDSYLFELPVFKSQYLRLRNSQSDMTFSSALENKGLQRALGSMTSGSSSGGRNRTLLDASLSLFRTLPDAPDTVGTSYDEDVNRHLPQVLVEAGGHVKDISIGMLVGAHKAGYPTAFIEPDSYFAAGIRGDFSGYTVSTDDGQEYYYTEPAATTQIGEIGDDIERRFFEIEETPPNS